MNRNVVIILFLFLTLSFACNSTKNREDKREDTPQTISQDSVETEKARTLIRARTLGLAYLEENNLEEAEKQFLKLIELAPKEALGYANLGIVYMRMGKYAEAEEQLEKAVELDPDDPDIRLNLARVYDMSNKEEKSLEELEKSIEKSPDHVQTLYSLAETYQNKSDENSLKQWESYLRKIVDNTPSNLVARLYLIEVLIRNKMPDEALQHLEEIEKISPVFPDDAIPYYDNATEELNDKNTEDALTSVRIFHNLLKLTNQYQTDIQQLKGAGVSSVGTPVISFSNTTPVFLMEGESLLDALLFTDVTSSSGLDTYNPESRIQPDRVPVFTIADMDRDGDQDIYTGMFDPQNQSYSPILLQNNMGRFENITRKSGIDHSGLDRDAVFADYDNDGFLDLYIAGEGQNHMYSNVNEGIFRDVTSKTGTGDNGNGQKILFFDIDQEGDLDLFIGNDSSVRIFRNNGDATFTDISEKLSFSSETVGIIDAVFNDFDDDGDMDLFLIDTGNNLKLYRNQRDLNFEEITAKAGIRNIESPKAVTAGDFDNNGFPDLFVVSSQGRHVLYSNNGEGIFNSKEAMIAALNTSEKIDAHDALFFDFDNDGFQDIILTGVPLARENSGIFLFHNRQNKFEDVSHMLPENIRGAYRVEVADYNEDGDMDIYLIDLQGRLRLIRNDGGNANHHLKIQLVGIRTGSGKNNYYGIGSKVEVRAGELYQMKTVTEATVHFGLGNREKVDVVRILWPNGVPQNIFSPGSDQDLIEEQELKGSCPFLYTWNGENFGFQKDMMWRSALGMPLGIMGESTSYAFADASREYLKIDGNHLKPRNNKYEIQITSELWETIYFDEIKLVAVDHPRHVEIFVDERFTPPPFPGMDIYAITEKKYPVSVMDENGRDHLDKIKDKDNIYITGFRKMQYQGITELHDLIIDLGQQVNTDSVILFLNGWIFPTDASINHAISQSAEITMIQPYVQVKNQAGEWVTVIDYMGFPMGKDKTVVLDMSNRFLSEDHMIRIRTNMEIYWDHIFYSGQPGAIYRSSPTINPSMADLHYRGFSRKYRKGGRYGPHWFDYNQISKDPKWRDLTGYYTRYGNVKELLLTSDNQYVIMNSGDEVTIRFDTDLFPSLPAGWTRDFLIYSVGWVKDGDLNTACGDTVEPLPYHGMDSYPYVQDNNRWDSKKLNDYIRTYNTRKVTNREFRNEIREYED